MMVKLGSKVIEPICLKGLDQKLDFIKQALRPKWWVIHLITPSGYKSRPPKWK